VPTWLLPKRHDPPNVWTVPLHDGIFAGAAAIPRPAYHPHLELSGDVVQHFSLVLADLMQRTAATGTGFGLDIHDEFDPRQMRWQRAAIALRRFATWRRLGLHRWRLHRLGRSQAADAPAEQQGTEENGCGMHHTLSGARGGPG